MHPVLGFVGPSGAGKTTLIVEILKRHPEKFGPVVTLTTRPHRERADDLFYVIGTHDDVRAREVEGTLFQVSEYAGNLYANDREVVNELLNEKIGVMAIVEQGVKNFRAAGYVVHVIKVVPQDAPLPADKARQEADKMHTDDTLVADFTLINSFHPGGKEKAIEELLTFVESIKD